MSASVPADLRNLRACLLCSLVKSVESFQKEGCENCEDVLHLKGDEEKVYDCTSANYDGMIAAMSNNESWVCKWQKMQRKVKGMYAISVSGVLPNNIVSELKSLGVRYKPNQRDYSTQFKK
ncbi:Transcription elongation factor SPT4 [Caenorhabditis elegans]|uniref:Transcription elongation factor SPT4 n=1 Tax=Caenorhabditis elegans TaxID=6239 RepID=SPT4H_CAEEL|nr:Transcription elongation factor SPT4 [Caenorhabditis elegans]Q9TZ93.1 RecName: Full=Transcription elongation factor SPT4; AltName: Full=DRB sensitivity-inducing factor small subunit; Short=DSIF small subunit [Caenorhabditis elegans]CCD66087.1 Transcription elongation factor SPT4 [Caenorhabditis elegans]|eukprot:NP_497135.1 Transcription elongation factor SPT4 [Caenorhabditis elegans]